METGKITEYAQAATKTLVKNSPKILTTVGIAGFFTTVVFAVKAKPKADERVEEARAVKRAETKNEQAELTAWETVKAVTPAYWPTAVSFVLSAAAVIGSDYISDKRQTALSAAYTIADLGLKEYQKKATEMLGDKKAQEIQAAVDKDKVDSNPPSKNTVIVTNKGSTLFFDNWSGRYFESDMDAVKRAINEINAIINQGEAVSLNDLYGEMGLPCVPYGDEFGWDINYNGLCEMDFSAIICEDGQRPCIVLKFNNQPNHYDTGIGFYSHIM